MIFSKFLAGLAALAATANAGLQTCDDVKALYQAEACCNGDANKIVDASDKFVQGYPAGTVIMHSSVDNKGEYVYLSTTSTEKGDNPAHAPSILVYKLGAINFTNSDAVPLTFEKEIIIGPPGQLAAYPNTEHVDPPCESSVNLANGVGSDSQRGVSCGENKIADWVFGGTSAKLSGGGYYFTQAHGPTWYPDFSVAHYTVWQDNRIVAIDQATNNIMKPNFGTDLALGTKSQNAHGLFFSPNGNLALDTGYTFGNNKLDLYTPVRDSNQKYTGVVEHSKEIFLEDGNGDFGAFTHFVTWLDNRYAYTGTMQTGRTSLDINGTGNALKVIPPSVWLIDTGDADATPPVEPSVSVKVENIRNCGSSAQEQMQCVEKPISDIKVVYDSAGDRTLLFVGQEDSLSNAEAFLDQRGIVLIFEVNADRTLTYLKRLSNFDSADSNGDLVAYATNSDDVLPAGAYTDGNGAAVAAHDLIIAVDAGLDTVAAANDWSPGPDYRFTSGIHGMNVCADGSCVYAFDWRTHVFHKISTATLKVTATYTERYLAHGAMTVGEYGSGVQKIAKLQAFNDGQTAVNSDMLVGTEIKGGHLFFVNTKPGKESEFKIANIISTADGGDMDYGTLSS